MVSFVASSVPPGHAEQRPAGRHGPADGHRHRHRLSRLHGGGADFRGHLGGDRLGKLVELGPQGDMGADHVADLYRVPAHPPGRKMRGRMSAVLAIVGSLRRSSRSSGSTSCSRACTAATDRTRSWRVPPLDPSLTYLTARRFLSARLQRCRNAIHFLHDDTQTYLREEIQQEGLVRNLGGFSRFLDLAAAQCGELVNFTAFGRESGLATRTVQAYYDILEGHDRASLGTVVPQPAQAPGRAPEVLPLSTTGVTNAVNRRLTAPPDPSCGAAFRAACGPGDAAHALLHSKRSPSSLLANQHRGGGRPARGERRKAGECFRNQGLPAHCAGQTCRISPCLPDRPSESPARRHL